MVHICQTYYLKNGLLFWGSVQYICGWCYCSGDVCWVECVSSWVYECTLMWVFRSQWWQNCTHTYTDTLTNSLTLLCWRCVLSVRVYVMWVFRSQWWQNCTHTYTDTLTNSLTLLCWWCVFSWVVCECEGVCHVSVQVLVMTELSPYLMSCWTVWLRYWLMFLWCKSSVNHQFCLSALSFSSVPLIDIFIFCQRVLILSDLNYFSAFIIISMR